MIQMQLLGAEQIAKAFAGLEKRIRRKSLKDAATAGKKIMTAGLKAAAPKETGTLQKAIGDKQKSYEAGAYHLGIIGARAGFKREITRSFTKRGKQRIKATRTKAKAAPGREVRDPSRYMHLPEGGRKAVKARGKAMPIRGADGSLHFARGAKSVKGKRFMLQTHKRLESAARKAMEDVLRRGIEEATRSAASAA